MKRAAVKVLQTRGRVRQVRDCTINLLEVLEDRSSESLDLVLGGEEVGRGGGDAHSARLRKIGNGQPVPNVRWEVRIIPKAGEHG